MRGRRRAAHVNKKALTGVRPPGLDSSSRSHGTSVILTWARPPSPHFGVSLPLSAIGGDYDPNGTTPSFANPLAVPAPDFNTGNLQVPEEIISPKNGDVPGVRRSMVDSRLSQHHSCFPVGFRRVQSASSRFLTPEAHGKESCGCSGHSGADQVGAK